MAMLVVGEEAGMLLLLLLLLVEHMLQAPFSTMFCILRRTWWCAACPLSLALTCLSC